jgi:hypothetical protein
MGTAGGVGARQALTGWQGRSGNSLPPCPFDFM